MIIIAAVSVLLWVLFPLHAWAEQEASDPQTITGAGAHFSWIIFDRLKPGLEKKYGRPLKLYGRQSMLGAGCNAGIKTAKKNTPGNESFGFVCCPLSKEEIEKEQLTVHPIATEPIVILVNDDNSITNLAEDTVRAIFRGDIKNWIEIGGPDKPIIVVTRLHCKHRPGHWKTILPSADLFRKDRLNVKSAAEMVKRVSDFPGAIGHTGATWKFGDQDKVKIIKVNNVSPTTANLRKKKYPFYRQLSAVTHGEISQDLKNILQDVQTSKEFRILAKKYGLLPAN